MSADMVYVAVKPNASNVAYAICADNPEFKKMTADLLAEWIKEGAQVKHVPREVGLDMLDKYFDSVPNQESLPL